MIPGTIYATYSSRYYWFRFMWSDTRRLYLLEHQTGTTFRVTNAYNVYDDGYKIIE